MKFNLYLWKCCSDNLVISWLCSITWCQTSNFPFLFNFTRICALQPVLVIACFLDSLGFIFVCFRLAQLILLSSSLVFFPFFSLPWTTKVFLDLSSFWNPPYCSFSYWKSEKYLMFLIKILYFINRVCIISSQWSSNFILY